MKKRIAIAIIKWLLRFAPDHALLSWDENVRLRKQVEDRQCAYDALLKEMEELLYG